MPTPQDLAQLRSRRDAALSGALAAEARIRALDTSIAAAQRFGQADQVAKLRAQRAEAAQTASAQRLAATQLRQSAIGQLGQWLQQTPEQIVGACSSAHPFVLLPVRIETKFGRAVTGCRYVD